MGAVSGVSDGAGAVGGVSNRADCLTLSMGLVIEEGGNG